MQELLVVNPSRRPSKRRKTSKPASPAQKRARAAFAAMARARAKSPAKRRKTSKPSNSITVMANPKRRRSTAKRRSNPAPRQSASVLKKPMAIIAPALTGAVGATVVNTALAKLPVPAALTTGKMKFVTQAAAAIALGAIAAKLGIKGAMAAQMAEGSLTVTLHQAITDIAAGAGMNLSGMGYYLPGYGVSATPSANGNPAQLAGMGKYVTGPGSGSGNSNVTSMPRPAQKQMRGFNF